MTAPLFKPTPKQMDFMDACMVYDEIGYGGALGGGKTFSLCWFAHTMSTMHPGNRGVVFRDTLVNLRDTTLNEFKIYMGTYYPDQPVDWRMSPSIECDITCPGGIKSTILWRETQDPGKVLSLNVAWAAIDEATQTSEEFYLTISGRIGRHLLPGGVRPPQRLVWGSNPGPGWCKQLFPVGPQLAVKKTVLDNGSISTRAFVPALHSDNPHLDPDYVPRLRAKYPDVWVRRWLEGNWDAFEGQCFDEFDEDIHTFDFFIDLPGSYWMHLITLDWGFRAPTACLRVSIDDERHFWVTKEYRASGRTPKEHEPYIRELAMGLPIRSWEMDYAALDQSSGIPIFQQFRDLGLPFGPCKKNKNGSDGSVFFLKQLMKEKRIHIHRSCAGLIGEIKEAMWEPQTANQSEKTSPKDRMRDINDHSIDALFMGLEFYRHRAGKPDPARIHELEEARRGRKEWRDERELEIFGGNVKRRDLAGKSVANEKEGNAWAM